MSRLKLNSWKSLTALAILATGVANTALGQYTVTKPAAGPPVVTELWFVTVLGTWGTKETAPTDPACALTIVVKNGSGGILGNGAAVAGPGLTWTGTASPTLPALVWPVGSAANICVYDPALVFKCGVFFKF